MRKASAFIAKLANCGFRGRDPLVMADFGSGLSVAAVAKISDLIRSWNSGKSMTMTSEHCITVCSQGDLWSASSLFFIQLAGSQTNVTRTEFERGRMRDRIISAARSPNGKVCLVLNAGSVLRVSTVEKEIIAEWPENTVPSVDFAGWIDNTNAVILTEQEIIHMEALSGKVGWSISRNEVVAKCYTATDYQLSHSRKWSFLALIKLDEDQARGLVNVFQLKSGTSKTFYGFAAAFAPTLAANDDVVLVASTVPNSKNRILVTSLTLADAQFPGYDSLSKDASLAIENPLDTNRAVNDFPIAVTVHSTNGLPFAFITTKMNYVHLIDYRKMCHLASTKLTEDESTNCVVHSARSSGGVMVINSDGMVFGVSVSLDNLVATLLSKNLPLEALKYAVRLNIPMGNDIFMRMVHVVRGATVDFETICALLRVNVVHLSGDQAKEMFKWIVDMASHTPHHSMLIGHLAMKLSDRIGLDVLISMFERSANTERLFMFLKSLAPKKMTESALLQLVKVALKHGLIQILELHFITVNSKILFADSVIDCLMSENAAPGSKHAVDELVEKLCIKYSLIIHLVTLRVRNEQPVRLDELLGNMPKEEFKEQLCMIIEILLQYSPDLGALEVKYNLGLTADMLQTVYPDVLQSLKKNETRNTTTSFLEYIVGKGIPDETVHSQLVKLYIETMEDDKLNQILRNDKFYDAVAVGQWCEKNNWLTKALMVYEERRLSADFIRLSGDLGVYKRQFNYLLKLSSKDHWESVLSPINGKRAYLVNIMLHQPEAGYNTVSGDFEQVAVLVATIAETDLVSETQTFIRRLLSTTVGKDQILFLQKHAVRSLLGSGYPPEKIQQVFGEQLYTYDPCIVAEALVQGGMLRFAKDILVKGKCWKEAAQLVAAHRTEGLGDIKELAFLSRDPELLATVAENYLKSGELVLALRYFLEAGRFKKYKLICSMVPLDSSFAEWELLIRFLEGALSTTKDPSVCVTLALAYGKTNRTHDLKKLMANESGSSGMLDVNCCRICEDLPKNVTFVPCGHMVVCMDCAKELSICPICRKPIDLKVKTFSV
ncbi:uncharacterized protein LOC129582247 isoform X2 [Paramacrobiotus metropolitanus]|uniref:uncharacterized protein LOC129582247 isoform X2 n=1 Tax=Paramacrobiotus metropolitanus TaxID=2943436 RepID=UPI002445CB25|nr:uncharacterized protein LOC129582247 isoform X2 [Paramacrobiotus metropolitanus]